MRSRPTSPDSAGAVPKRGVFHSIVDLRAAINRFIEDHIVEPKPFAWTAHPEVILDKVTAAIQPLAAMHQ